MRRSFTFLAVAGLSLAACAAPDAGSSAQSPDVQRTALHDYRITTVASGLVNPWSMAFLPSGDMLVTERPGRLRIVRGGALLEAPVAGVPEVFAEGQGGLLDVAVHPDFANNGFVYLTYSKPLGEGQSSTALIRGRLENDALVDVEELFVAQTRGAGHYGSRIAFDGNGHVFVSLGDRQVPPQGDLESHPAQRLTDHHGTLIRLNDDGSIPSDNPFVGRDDALPEIWSWGHRNMQGLIVDPETGDVWTTEHGPQGGDELNLEKAGANYGWPVVGYGVNYRTGTAIHAGTMREGMENPTHVWVPSIGVSGLMRYDGAAFGEWQGDIFSGGLSGARVDRLEMEGQRVVVQETIFRGMGRVRDVRQGPDGFVYIAIEMRDGTPTDIVRLEPAN